MAGSVIGGHGVPEIKPGKVRRPTGRTRHKLIRKKQLETEVLVHCQAKGKKPNTRKKTKKKQQNKQLVREV
jgi:hypothetical protein